MPLRKDRAQALRTLAVLTCLAITGALIYANALNAPFVFDDTVFLDNPKLLFTDITLDRITGLTRITTENVSPRLVPNFTFAINYYLCRRHVPGYHLFNLLIHIVTAGLVFLVCRRTMARCRDSSDLIPALAALLWLTSPLHIQSVTYIWQRMNSLATLFFMAALYCYIKAREAGLAPQGTKKTVSGFFFAAGSVSGLLALASKQTAATLPIILVLYEWFFFQKVNTAWLKKKLPWLCLAGLAGCGLALFYLDAAPIKTIFASYADKSFTPGQRLLTEPRIILYYITLLLFPHPVRLNLDVDFPLSTALLSPAVTVPAIIALICLTAAAVFIAKKHRLMSFAIFWFLTNLLIESSVVGLDLIYQYRTYMPSIFPFMALTALVFRTVRSQRTAVSLLAAVIVLSGWWTFRHNTTWQSNVTLWRDITKKSPLASRPYHNLGLAYKESGACDKAAPAYRQALAIRLTTEGPDHYKTGETYNNLGAAYDCLGDVTNAVDSYQKALVVFSRRFGPDHPKTTAVYNNLCVLYGRNKDFGRAVFWCNKALTARSTALGPDHPEVADLHNNLGLALSGAGKSVKAEYHLRTALRIYRRHLGDQHPQTRQCRENLTQLLYRRQAVTPKPQKPDNFMPDVEPESGGPASVPPV